MPNRTPQRSAPWVTSLRQSILTLPLEDQKRLSEQEQANAEYFLQYAQKYKHRIVLPLDTDPFAQGLKERLEAAQSMFARVPFKSINTVYYLFHKMEDVQVLIQFTQSLENVPPSATTH